MTQRQWTLEVMKWNVRLWLHLHFGGSTVKIPKPSEPCPMAKVNFHLTDFGNRYCWDPEILIEMSSPDGSGSQLNLVEGDSHLMRRQEHVRVQQAILPFILNPTSKEG